MALKHFLDTGELPGNILELAVIKKINLYSFVVGDHSCLAELNLAANPIHAKIIDPGTTIKLLKPFSEDGKIIQDKKHYEAKIADLLDEIESSRDASKDMLKEDDAITKFKQRISDLVYENNRYHLAISNCTFCASDKPDSTDASTFLEASIRASTPLPSLDPGPASLSSTIPALMSITWDTRQANTVPVQKSKDQTFINRMVKALTKLETKYKTPEHKRKKRLFTRKQRTCPIVPNEFSSIFHVLAAPEPEPITVSEPFPHVRWNEVRFKPSLPNPEPCSVYSCSQDPDFYRDAEESLVSARPKNPYDWSVDVTRTSNKNLAKFKQDHPFGILPGYKTSLGVVSVPTTPVGGYVYCPDARRWVIHATLSAGRGTNLPPRRRRG